MTWQRIAYFALPAAAIAVAGAVLFQRDDADADAPPYVIDHGVVDAATGIGYLRYTGNCLWCHGPDENGSSFGPALVDSLKTLTYEQFLDVVTSDRKDVSNSQFKVMPAVGTNASVMCFIDDIYAYLKARSDGAIGAGRPESKQRTKAQKDADDSCVGTPPQASKSG
jgi:methanol metabolism-related c-type cytochrome